MNKLRTTILLILLSLSLTACGGSTSETSSYEYTDTSIPYNNSASFGTTGGSGYKAESAAQDTYYDEGVYPEEESVETQSIEAEETGRKMIYTYDVEAEASDVAATRINILLKVHELGGYLAEDNFNESYDGREEWRATVRIPEEHRESLFNQISADTRVTYSNISVEDVTLNYADNEARLRVEKQAYAEYEELLQHATTAEELVTIRNELYRIQANIEAYETTLRYMQNDIDYTKFYIGISETRLGVNEERNLGSAFIIACQDAVEDLLSFFADVVIGIPGFIIAIIIIAFYLLIGFIIFKVLSFIWKRLKKKLNITWRPKSRLERAAEIFAAAYKEANKEENKKEEEESK